MLKVLTFNVLSADIAEVPTWDDRRDVALALLHAEDPDLFGAQEATFRQVNDMAAALPGHRWLGWGRDGGSRGEFNAVFVRHDRFQVEAFDQFWLSETPRLIGSPALHARAPRVVTWARLRDRKQDQRFSFVNTHLDFESARSRHASAAALLDFMGERPKEPMVLVGDFNADAGADPVYAELVGDGRFADAWVEGRDGPSDTSTFHGFGESTVDAGRIDWILTRGFSSSSARVIAYARDGVFPSDHHPVVARLELPVG